MLSAGERKLAKMARPRAHSTFREEGLRMRIPSTAHAHPEALGRCRLTLRRARPGRRPLCLCVTLGHGRARCGTAAAAARRECRYGRRAGQKGISMSAGPSLVGSSSSLSARALLTLGSLRTM